MRDKPATDTFEGEYMKQTKPVEEMDWEVRFEKEFQIRERVVDHTWDKFKNDVYPSEIKDFIREVRATAVKEERERTKQVVRQAQIAMEYIEDDEQADWCLARFDAMLDEDLKLQQPK